MKNIMEAIFRIFLMIFLIWIGFCAYNLSQNGRYQIYGSSYRILDTHTGNMYVTDRNDNIIKLRGVE
jgi:hypothetical protein